MSQKLGIYQNERKKLSEEIHDTLFDKAWNPVPTTNISHGFQSSYKYIWVVKTHWYIPVKNRKNIHVFWVILAAKKSPHFPTVQVKELDAFMQQFEVRTLGGIKMGPILDVEPKIVW